MTEKRGGGPADWRKRLEAILAAKKKKLAKAHPRLAPYYRACPWCGLPLGRAMRAEAALAAKEEEVADCRREIKQACIALADEFVPAAERSGAHLQGLPRLVAHAVKHHQWHHDAADASYVAQVEADRDRLAEELAGWRNTAEKCAERGVVLEDALETVERHLATYLDAVERTEQGANERHAWGQAYAKALLPEIRRALRPAGEKGEAE